MERLVAHNWGTTTLGDCAAIVASLLRPGKLAEGPEITRYEQDFARRTGVGYAVSFASGRLALFAILKALGVGAGDEVLLQVPTHIVVPNAIRYTGATPTFVDCSLDDYNMDLSAAAAKVTAKTRVLLLQHTFGIPADLDAARSLAKANDLVLVEDCVHALGARFAGKPVGSLGRAAFFSTEETKTISSTMGGMAVTDDAELAAAIREVQTACEIPPRSLVARYLTKQVIYHLFTHPRMHRLTRPIYMWLRQHPFAHLAPGATDTGEMSGTRPSRYKIRLGNGQAAVARRQLRRLDANLAHRGVMASRYIEGLSELGFAIPRPTTRSEPAYVRFPTRVIDRDAAMETAEERVVLGRWFTSVLEESVTPSVGGYVEGSCPHAEQAGRELINLPTHPRTTKEDVNAVLAILARVEPAVSKT